MTKTRADWLVETDWLADHLSDPDLVVIDGSTYLSTMGRDGRAEYLEAHVPGAVFFDIDEISDQASPLPHMLPRPEVFASKVRKLGIGDGQRIVVYDGFGLFSAARVWWMFRIMGVDEVAVLNGGFPKWTAEGRPTDQGSERRHERHFTARKRAGYIADKDDVRRALAANGPMVMDARPADRFAGTAPEPRTGVRSGHEPGTVNLPYSEFTDTAGCVKSNAELDALFRAAGHTPGAPLITMCGSGLTAAIPFFALTLLGHDSVSLYDGSWAEWGQED